MLTAGGSGYSATPIVAITRLSPVQVTATARVDMGVSNVAVAPPVAPATWRPSITFVGGGGFGAVAHWQRWTSHRRHHRDHRDERRLRLHVGPVGRHHRWARAGAAATATITGTIVAIDVTNPGSGYTTAPP